MKINKSDSVPLNVFFIYSREDKNEIHLLKDYLTPLEKEGEINLWIDDNILPGENWDEKIKLKISESHIILLGISKSFFTSNYIENTELVISFKRQEQKNVIIIPVLIKPCLWDINKKISSLQLLPSNGRAITTWNNTDEAFEDVSRGVHRIIKNISFSDDGRISYSNELEEEIENALKYYEEKQDSTLFQRLNKILQKSNQLPAKVYHALGYMYGSGKGTLQNYHEALRLYLKSAELGYPSSQHNLGNLYETGQGVNKDFSEALKWYSLAASQDYSYSINRIGKLYEDGLGVKQDYVEAMKWYLRAADQGDDFAQFNVGYLYLMGWGVEKNSKKAFEWFLKASEKNNVEALSFLGYLNQIVIGNNASNHNEAIKWYVKAAELGSEMALTNLGLIYIHGEGQLPDYNKAYLYFSKAADLGNTSAMCNLAKMLLDGLGVGKNYERAFSLFKRAADAKVVEAYSHLAGMYENGWGTAKNKQLAIFYYEKALEVNWNDDNFKNEMRNRVAGLKFPIIEHSFIAKTLWKIFN